MTNDTQRQSAKVYKFPVGGRAALSSAKPAAEMKPVRAGKLVIGSSWYHGEAVEEAELARRR